MPTSRTTADILNADATQIVIKGAQIDNGYPTSGSLATISPSSGTGLQASTSRDVLLNFTLTTDGTNNINSCVVALSPDNSTYSTVQTYSVAAALSTQGAFSFGGSTRVPAGWFVKFTLVRMTIGNATVA